MHSAVLDRVDYDLGRYLACQDAADDREDAVAQLADSIYPKGCCVELIERAIPDMPLKLAQRLVTAVNQKQGMAVVGDVLDEFLRVFAYEEADNEITDRENKR